MKDVFQEIDKWDHKLNIFRDHVYLANVAFYFSMSMIVLWGLFGFDSGVGMIEEALKGLPDLAFGNIGFAEWKNQIYSVYGRSFHFSAFVIYGFLFHWTSYQLDRLGLKGSKNSFYSAFLVCLNISVFELWYMACFAHFQMQRNLIEWLITDLWFLQQYFFLLLLGIMGYFAFWLDSYKINNNKVVGKHYRFVFNWKVLLVVGILLASILFWIYYPFPTKEIVYGDWVSSDLFPQTHYAYVKAKLYIEDNLVHSVNLIVKSLFAFTQLCILDRFRKVQNGL